MGALFIDEEFFCFTIEDGETPDPYGRKVPGQTRIPAGEYKLGLRGEGGMVQEYRKIYGSDHKMLWLQDVPGFEFIYMHHGNTPRDTKGCILLNFAVRGRPGEFFMGSDSRQAYALAHALLAKAVEAGQDVWVEVRDEWRVPNLKP